MSDRHAITVYCDGEDLEPLKRAILRVRDYLQQEGEKGDIWLTSKQIHYNEED